MLPKILLHHRFCYDKLTNLYLPSFLFVFPFFFLSTQDSPSPNIAVTTCTIKLTSLIIAFQFFLVI